MEKVKDMEKVRFQVLGYRNFKKKADGKPLTVLTAFYQCTPQDNERGSFGCKYTDFFLPDDKVGTLQPSCIGQEFIHQYGINGFGSPALEDFSFKEWKAQADMEGYETVYDLEEPAGEPEPEGEPGQETASGNDLSVSGNDSAASGDVTVFPEGYDLSAPGGELLLM